MNEELKKIAKKSKVLPQKMQEIRDLFEQLDGLISSFSSEESDAINDFHNNDYSLIHCTRFGLQGSEEILEFIESQK